MKFLNKTKKILKDDRAAFSAPVITMGCILFAVLMLIFCDSLKMASNGFKAREVANTIAKQISVTGEISQDTIDLAKSCINEFEESEGNENRFVTVNVLSENGGILQQWGTSYINGVGSNESYDLRPNMTSQTTSANKVQLGKSCTVEVVILNKKSTVSSGEISLTEEGNKSVFRVRSTAVSQVYWKELDKNAT